MKIDFDQSFANLKWLKFLKSKQIHIQLLQAPSVLTIVNVEMKKKKHTNKKNKIKHATFCTNRSESNKVKRKTEKLSTQTVSKRTKMEKIEKKAITDN